MENALAELGRVAGVFGSFVTDETGKVLAQHMPTNYPADALTAAGQTASMLMQGIATSAEEDINQVEWEYDEFRLISRKFDGGLICLLCAKTLSLPLLDLTYNVVIKKVEDIIKTGGAAKPASKPSGPTVSAGFFTAVEAALAQYLGPIARLLTDEKLGEMDEERGSLPVARAGEFIDKLGSEIGDPAQRSEFVEKARAAE